MELRTQHIEHRTSILNPLSNFITININRVFKCLNNLHLSATGPREATNVFPKHSTLCTPTMPSYRYCIVLTNSSWVFQTAMPVPWCSERRCTFIPDVADRGLKVRQLWDLSIFLMLFFLTQSQILHVCIYYMCCILCIIY